MLADSKSKQTRVQVIISKSQKEFLDEVSANQGMSISVIIRKMVESYRTQLLEEQLQDAAKSLYAEYESNEELTAFTSLDGEDFA